MTTYVPSRDDMWGLVKEKYETVTKADQPCITNTVKRVIRDCKKHVHDACEIMKHYEYAMSTSLMNANL